jgi:ubiquinone/menaquinone biosynthesis C-methylase UbiE
MKSWRSGNRPPVLPLVNSQKMSRSQTFTPAAGRFLPTSAYDRLLALLTREARWRSALLEAIAPAPGERILDVGCGTGSLAILIKQAAPDTMVVGLDPDEVARCIAWKKAGEAGVGIEWESGFARDAGNYGQFDKVVSSLVFHQVPVAEKRVGLAAMFAATKSGGTMIVCDYAAQDAGLCVRRSRSCNRSMVERIRSPMPTDFLKRNWNVFAASRSPLSNRSTRQREPFQSSDCKRSQ